MWVLSFLLLCCAPLSQAAVSDMFAELFGPPERKASTRASYQIRQYQSSEVHGTSEELKLRQHSAELTIPLSQDYEQKWKLHLNSHLDEVRTNASFANCRTLPSSLWNLETGVSHTRQLEGDRFLAGTIMIGSPSDRPFGAFRDVSFQGNIIYKIPKDENAWLLMLSLSNTRGFMNYIPLPGIAYSFKASSTLRLILGIPFLSAFWTPFEKTVVSFVYFPIYHSQLRISYFLFGPAQIYFQGKYQSKNFFLSERSASKERLFYEEANLQGGVSMPLERFVTANFSAGYAFERKYFLAEKSTKWREAPMRRLEKSAFADLKFNFIF